MSPEQSREVLSEAGRNWLYGNGVGQAAVTAGTIAAFPPYAVYVVGNSILSLSGYEELRITDALPESGRREWDEVYDGVTSGPGRFAAAVSGEEFRTPERAEESFARVLRDPAAREREEYLTDQRL